MLRLIERFVPDKRHRKAVPAEEDRTVKVAEQKGDYLTAFLHPFIIPAEGRCLRTFSPVHGVLMRFMLFLAVGCLGCEAHHTSEEHTMDRAVAIDQVIRLKGTVQVIRILEDEPIIGVDFEVQVGPAKCMRL